MITTTLDADDLSRAVIDAIPSPLFIVDEDMRITAYNEAAGALLGRGTAPLTTRAGEVLHCINSTAVAEGCGRAEACKTCIVRSSVGESIRNRKVMRRAQRMVLVGETGDTEVFLLVTTAPLPVTSGARVILILEDIGELVEVRKLLPICMHCGRIKEGEEYWASVDAYLKKHLDLDTTHGLCTECMRKHYPDLANP